jgi:hypothetical protein
MKPKDGTAMIASTGASAEVCFQSPAQSRFGPGTHGMRADADDPRHIRICGTNLSWLGEEVDPTLWHQGSPWEFA